MWRAAQSVAVHARLAATTPLRRLSVHQYSAPGSIGRLVVKPVLAVSAVRGRWEGNGTAIKLGVPIHEPLRLQFGVACFGAAGIWSMEHAQNKPRFKAPSLRRWLPYGESYTPLEKARIWWDECSREKRTVMGACGAVPGPGARLAYRPGRVLSAVRGQRRHFRAVARTRVPPACAPLFPAHPLLGYGAPLVASVVANQQLVFHGQNKQHRQRRVHAGLGL